MALRAYITDSSARTSHSRRAYLTVVVAGVLFIISIFGYMAGVSKYNSLLAQSSTPIGTQMEFKRSNVKCSLSGLYVDDGNNVLVARISFDNPSSSVRMPFRGTDYATFVSSRAIPGGVNKISALTGRLSSDGDMFVVLPGPDQDAVYSLFVMNTKFLGDRSSGGGRSDVIDIRRQTESLTAALSRYNYNDVAVSGGGSYEIEGDNADAIGFRVTLNPSINDSIHRPTRLPVTLLDDSGEFDFRAFFETVFVESAQSELENQFNELTVREEDLRARGAEMAERIAFNASDGVARREYMEITKQLQRIEADKQQVVDMLEAYRRLSYDESLFANLNTEATVLR